MTNEYTKGVRSKASILGHPLHPMIIPFPIAFLVGTLATDIVFAATRDPFWARGSFWLLIGALVMATLAAVLGLIDFVSIPRARNRVGWTHVIGNVLAVVLSLISVIHRWDDPTSAVLPLGLVLSAIVVLILGVTGWMGGELAFRYKVGVIEPDQDAAAQTPLRRAAE